MTSDEEWMARYQQGDLGAFQRLYDRYSGRVYGFLFRRTQDDQKAREIFQTVFMKLHQTRSSYRQELGFAPWLFTICRNAFLDSVKSAHSRHEKKSTSIEDHPNLFVPSDESSEGADATIESLLGQLPEDQKELLAMRYVEDLTFSQIALRLKLSEAGVRQRISRSIRRLRKLVSKKELAV